MTPLAVIVAGALVALFLSRPLGLLLILIGAIWVAVIALRGR